MKEPRKQESSENGINGQDREAGKRKHDAEAGQSAKGMQPGAGGQEHLPEEDESISVSEETRGNRADEKIENRAAKKQETHEEAKVVTGTEAHHDPRNESPDSGPAPLDRY